MKFFNASEGLRKIRKAEILAVISVFGMLIAALMAAYLSYQEKHGALTENGTGAVGIALLAITFISMLVIVISFFMQLKGLQIASKDEGNFKTACWLIYIGIATSLIASILESAKIASPLMSSISELISNISEMAIIYLVCQGTINLLMKSGQPDLADKGNNILTIVIAAYLLSAIAEVGPSILGFSKTTSMIYNISEAAGAILQLIGLFSYIGFLGSSADALGR